jgi:hypothetical protein
MSATESAVANSVSTGSGLPAERRLLVALLAALEGALLVVAGVLAYLYRPQVVPVDTPAGLGSSGYGCVQPGGPIDPAPYPCPTPDNAYQIALLAAVICSALALLVLPAVIGFVSRRWQTALAVPAIPLWVALLVVVGFSLAADANAYTSYGGSLFSAIGVWSLVLSLAGQALSGLLLAIGFGGLAWLARRAFAR